MPYTPQQTVFFLQFLSNLALTQKGTAAQLEQFLAEHIDAHIAAQQSDIGTWTRVWGPAVFQVPASSVADNVMYVACDGATPPQYVVGIAGTNFNSIFDILIEDFFVGTQVPWRYGRAPSGAAISAGAFTGLTALQVLTPAAGYPGAGQHLNDFLASVATQPIQVIAAGHSLGGALAPLVALWLLDTQASWDPQSNATISSQPTAGPTAGNAAFAQYYDGRLGPVTTRFHNSIDIVPHAWNDTDLSELPALYQPDIAPDIVVDAFVAAARAAASGGAYTQIDTDSELDGTVNTSIINPQSWGFENYLAQAAYQHIDEYFTLMNVTIGGTTAAIGGASAQAGRAAARRIQAVLERRGAIPAGSK